MKDILDAFAEYNLFPGEVIPDGSIHRFKIGNDDKKRSGWYVGYQNHTRKSGETFHVVVFGNYQLGETWTYQTGTVSYSSEDRKHIASQIEKVKRENEIAREKVQEEISKEVTDLWDSLECVGTSSYLSKKQIENNQLGIRFDSKGNLYVPLKDINGKLWSLQKIQWDGGKFYHPGGRVLSNFHMLGDPTASDTIYITEGFATGASVFIATGACTVIGFTSGKLEDVACIIRRAYPDANIIIAGDDDCWSKTGGENKNNGREKADLAAKRSLGRAIFPRFTGSIDKKPTDFNDLHVYEGIEKVREQLLNIELPPKIAVYALGFKENEYFFTSTQNRQVIGITNFSEDNLLKLMSYDYWEALFPSKTGIDWTAAKNSLMIQCRTRGIFQPRHVRGAGVWNDQGRVIVNMGDHLLVDGQKISLGNIKTKYFYTLGSSLHELHKSPLSCDECDILVSTCSNFKWLKPDFGFLLAGALVTARICGALPVRPHIWITGSAQTGKSTLLERLIKPMLGENCLYALNGTSEAGIRQSLRADAIPVLMDEFETMGKESAEKIASIIELFRASWSDSSAMIIKGGSQGNATAYQVRFSAIVSSIRTALTNDADRSRFAIIELAPHGSNPEQWKNLSSLLDQIDIEYGNRLFARTIQMVPILLENFKTLKSELARRSSMRFGDQYGMLLAGYSILLDDEPLTVGGAAGLVDACSLTDEREESRISDHEECINQLLTQKAFFDIQTERRELVISEAMVLAATDTRYNEALQRIGIRVNSEDISIASGHTALENLVFKNTRWSMKWGNSLARIEGAKKNWPVRILGRLMKSTILPIDKVLNDK